MENDQEAKRAAYEARLQTAFRIIQAEVLRIFDKHGPTYNSFHELASVLREEYEEFWDEVKADNDAAAIMELVQTAAVAARGVAQYMGLEVYVASECVAKQPLSTLDVKRRLRRLTPDQRNALADSCQVHFAILNAYVGTDTNTNNQFTPEAERSIIAAARDLYPEIFA